jgi:hypothetical protein
VTTPRKRRTVLSSGSALIAGTAGCLGLLERDPSSDEPSQDDAAPENDGSTATDAPTSEATTTDTDSLTGERVVERHLTDDGFSWLQLNDPSEQLTDTRHAEFLPSLASNFDFENETVTFETGSNAGETIDIDAVYIAFAGNGDAWNVRIGYLNGSLWEDGAVYSGNEFWATSFAGTTTTKNALKTFLGQDVQGYDDISPEFPEAMLTLDGDDRDPITACLGNVPMALYDLARTGSALDADSGDKQWQFEVVSNGGTLVASPAIVDGTMYVGGGGVWKVFAVDASTGEERWRVETGSDMQTSTVRNETVYVGSSDGIVYAFEAASGDERWRFETDTFLNSTAVADGTVYAASRDGRVHAVDADDGSELWQTDAGGNVRASPVVVGSTVHVGTYDNGLVALDAKTGEKQWHFLEGEGYVPVHPVVTGGVVYTVGGERLHALTSP